MYRFILHTSRKKNKEINSAYISLFKNNHPIWSKHETEYERIRASYAQLGMCWTNYSYWQLFVASWRELIRIYYSFSKLVKKKKISDSDLQSLKKCFPYTNHRDKIDRFIVQNMEYSNSTTCAYCDAALVSFKSADYMSFDGNDSYEWDHFLDKSDCPIIALSLHNFVPVCHRCNHIKSSNIFGDSIKQTSQLSPMNIRYDFEHGVYFSIEMPKDQILKIKNIQQFHPFIVKETYLNNIYRKEINVTHVINRIYNDEGVQKEIWHFICEENNHSMSLWKRLLTSILNRQNTVKDMQYAELKDTTSRVRYSKIKRDILNKYFQAHL